MTKKPTNVMEYLKHGCGRCPLGDTPECKVHAWRLELKVLREMMLQAGLVEEIKWSVPCYTHKGKNIAVVAALKDHCSVSFFKGAGLDDPSGVLERPGENSQAARVLRLTSTKQIRGLGTAIEGFIRQAVALEESGYKLPKTSPTQMDWPSELVRALEGDSRLREAFEALTPGRQRGYLLYVAGAKQSKTRMDRIEKKRERILNGLGLQD
ncbi:MAG: YdeI/OmpD-associated family protein, partial [Pirellula sp.]